MADWIFALDRSLRRIDENGFLHVERCHISKACVSPYYGREIPGWQDLGLESEKVYQLLRDPVELANGAETSNNLQLMDEHIISSAENPNLDQAVGSLGTDAKYNEPYLDNSLVVYDGEAIARIETGVQKQISMAYLYVPDMTPGTYKGLRYDGIMRNIRFNHAALVPEGRAGPDVVVGDADLGAKSMPKVLTSRKALIARGVLMATVRPILATDAKIDMNAVLDGVNRANFGASKATIVTRLGKALKGKVTVAADADMPDFKKALDSMDDEEDGAADEDKIDAEDADPDDDKAKDADPDDDKAKDADPDDCPPGSTKDKKAKDRAKDRAKDADKDDKAMDAKIKLATDAVAANFLAVRQAEIDVRPFVGELANPHDTPAGVYKYALDSLGIDLTGIPEVAYAAVLKMQAAPKGEKTKVAMDAATVTDAYAAFPGLAHIRQA